MVRLQFWSRGLHWWIRKGKLQETIVHLKVKKNLFFIEMDYTMWWQNLPPNLSPTWAVSLLAYLISFPMPLYKQNHERRRTLTSESVQTVKSAECSFINFALAKLLRTATEEKVREREKEAQSGKVHWNTLQLGFHPKASTKSLWH